jgi:hypothetical protein
MMHSSPITPAFTQRTTPFSHVLSQHVSLADCERTSKPYPDSGCQSAIGSAHLGWGEKQLKLVQAGKAVVITDRQRPVARLTFVISGSEDARPKLLSAFRLGFQLLPSTDARTMWR